MVNLQDYIRDINDFPKRGVVFKDITPLLASKEASEACLNGLVDLLEGQKVDKVVGIESRGFFFGMLLAQRLNAGFVPIRKSGKLPFDTIKEPYSLEYGMDVLEMHEDAIKKGEKVLLHDDVLATGGTAKAACKLIEKLGGEVVQCNFIIELGFLRGGDKLNRYEIRPLISY
ncbi:adenine phosphoribosyltransferase [Ulvibacter antarcticus]|uniref:Adenine phosphoribosyltransferase n=1 Tax=Ulvibacter antarcticus TaxID=442714 RepID=A0A3L9YAR7_9FLAO|nr:adenine phosphoribosyltransferase [Ulvibacter antarcticus]RMA57826.1 adenine phosphoribosyltransferase [Ulvibacter antarcticus]